MAFDESLERLWQRITAYTESRQADIIFCEAALAEAADLERASEPADPGNPASSERQRRAGAAHAVGWLHFLRFTATPDGRDTAELARALVFFGLESLHADAIPESLRGVVGPTADPDARSELAGALLADTSATSAPEIFAAAVGLLTAAVAATPHEHADRAKYLRNLGFAYQERFRYLGASPDQERAIKIFSKLVDDVPRDHEDRAGSTFMLGRAYLMRFERSGMPSDLDRAIEFERQAVDVTPHDHPDHVTFVSGLSRAHLHRFSLAGATSDLDQAIELSRQAVDVAPHDHPDRAGLVANLGITHQTRFERLGTTPDLDQAIDLAQQAVDATPPDDPAQAGFLSNLATAQLLRFERVGMTPDLVKGIGIFSELVRVTPDEHPRRSEFLNSLGSAHLLRFERTGTMSDLEQGIELGQQAVDTAPGDHPLQTMYLNNLCVRYQLRFERLGAMSDLERAIEIGEQVVAATPADHPDRPGVLSDLGISYRRRFLRSGAMSDLEQAIEIGEQVVAATPLDHPDRVKVLSTLGAVYSDRFARVGTMSDLEQAIEVTRQAVAATPPGHPDLAKHLHNLGAGHHDRFKRLGATSDLERAIEIGEQVIAATPDDHPSRAIRLVALGGAYRSRFDEYGQRPSRSRLSILAHQVSGATTSSPVDRTLAGHIVGSLAHEIGEHDEAVKLLTAAVALLPLVASRETGWADREHRLGEHMGLVGEAVAAQCAAGDPVGAVETAELGRGILLAAQLDSRTDLTDLDSAAPELAGRFRQIRDRLTTSAEIADRRRWWVEHDEVLAEIRQRTGFDRFLLPPRLADLRPAAADGAVVLLNAGRCRSDAIIIPCAGAPLVSIPLPGLVLADVRSHAAVLVEATHDDSNFAGALRQQRVVQHILSWLWTSVVQPTLDALSEMTDIGESLPRVWWMPTGLLGLFPLHAAGHPGEPGALDRVVSSYTPTLRALAHARARRPATVRSQLTVALEHTPGERDLPGTAAEAAALHPHHAIPPLTDQDATTGRVLAALSEATWAHFACHARADLTTPSLGGLRLHDGTLSLPEISALHLVQAELAYLSACSTALGGFRHADESLHLASGFQLAGFRHVIASLWPLDDQIAADAASSFYRHLSHAVAADAAPTALHKVTRDLRFRYPDRPGLWASLIHSGA
ncbi:CHAT domain-containing protein [Amycolatopsis alba]|uniref:CHAT domain-containing protein n=1 Tax=Amycolatopsis alba DSM 44262 TaxID=1125972 RepID=A0A229SAH0_AMYAL|nr:CHAT domain-containing tetratricopeptide repeat protein [Amycolatopsis alba]OXM55584.1 CHAT domain-containing protein [Amycolatopsis alba DSM 44262]